MGNFLPAVEVVFQHEFNSPNPPGGFIIVKGDKGGPTTTTGITFETFKKALGVAADFDGDGDVDLDDFRLFSHDRDSQLRILYAQFWEGPGIALIRDQRIATKAFDLAVHAGPRASVILLQRAINQARPPGVERVKEDGALGPKSLAALAACDPDLVVAAYASEQAGFYLRIIQNDPTQERFKVGWLARAKWGTSVTA
jgi:type VI secretion system secreted protein VgrG